ncbi:putative AAA+ superfamily ATPase [Pedobacter africanus]|uniref:AAA+ superfamily ATPase n=1 Tax=Pedobacter africanus TaxID=151894 RepID=A0ACC6L2L4_9SPHI|nr:ATP-binding protein [Pedobacter africanus]MDR6785726.1 putative AAA+ superfamily ATPase [Pedobacter africanus]
MIERTLQVTLKKKVDYKKAIIVLGPRQVGKTTLISQIAADLNPEYIYINGDDPATRLSWANPSQAFINNYIGNAKVVVIDEAQRLENIGLSAKMIIDSKKDIQLFISGSSALEIANSINEPLTGRKWEYRLYPFSWKELKNSFSFPQVESRLENFLITGMYPDVILNPGDAVEILNNLAGSYLYKDILESGGVRRPDVLLKLLQALAWQVGNEVSYNELAQTVGADKVTISSYIDLLEKSFVIFRLNPFSRNLRNEISSTRKIYFYDNGVRNTVINNFAPISERNDVGALWENFIISERKKQLSYSGFYGNTYFWRNTAQAEIDYMEEQDGKISAYEIKWNPKVKVKFPKVYLETYQPNLKSVINRDNYWEFLG